MIGNVLNNQGIYYEKSMRRIYLFLSSKIINNAQD